MSEGNIIIKKLEEHDKRFSEHDKRFDKIDKRFSEHDKRFDKIIDKLVEHDGRLDQMVTKNEFNTFKDQILTGQDKMMQILQRLDQERIFTQEWIKRIEKEVENHTKEISKIKRTLKIA